uniref:Uncharacterized protein n=1 Tax=Schistocephalus solidus TaxID=70667 RepID=A0A0X3NQN9_SCHSO
MYRILLWTFIFLGNEFSCLSESTNMTPSALERISKNSLSRYILPRNFILKVYISIQNESKFMDNRLENLKIVKYSLILQERSDLSCNVLSEMPINKFGERIVLLI